MQKFLGRNVSTAEGINRNESRKRISKLSPLLIVIIFDIEIYCPLFNGLTFISPGMIAKSFINRWQSYLVKLWKKTGINFGTLYVKLHALCAAPLNFPLK